MAINIGAGYRDPAKTMTIKALQDRQKQAALASQKAVEMPQQISDPWQAVSHVMGVAGAGFEEAAAGRQEANARAQLSQIMSGIDPEKGASMAQIGQMQQLDPDFANKEYERMMTERSNVRNREDTQQFQHGESELTRQHEDVSREDTQAATADENNLNRQADLARQKQSDAAAAGRQDDQQAATEELARIQAQLEQKKADAAAAAKVTSIGTETDAKIEEAKKLGLQPGSPEYQKYVFDISKPASTNIYNQGDQPAFQKESDTLAAKRLGDTVTAGAEAKPFMAQLKIVADLGAQIGTGKGAEIVQSLGPYAKMVGIDLAGLDEGQAYQAIVDKMAPNMRVAGAGPSSDFDAKQFLSSLPSLGRTPEGNAIITATFDAITQNKMAAADLASKAQSQEITWQEAERQIRALPDPYETYKKSMGDQGGGGGDEDPVFDPQTDHEGATGENSKGTWTVQGGKWVLTGPKAQ